ncbi:MAG: hypothetical protein VCB25_04585 [Myxococcota bacterium]
MMESFRQEDVVQTTLREAWDLFANDFVLWIIAGLLALSLTIFSLGILSGPMTIGFILLIEKRRQGEAGSVADLFEGFSYFGTSLGAFLLIVAGVAIGSFLFVLPGLLFGLAMAFTFHAIAIDGENATGAMTRSFNLIWDNLALSTIFLVIVLVLSGMGGAVIFGTLLTMPFTLILTTLAYHRLSDISAMD